MNVYFGGDTRGKKAAAAAVFVENGEVSATTEFLKSASKIEAEYEGLLLAISICKKTKCSRPIFIGTNKVVADQVNGLKTPNSKRTSELLARVHSALSDLDGWWTVLCLPSYENYFAVLACDMAIDESSSFHLVSTEEDFRRMAA
jgi:ribonuclease HI